MDRTAHSLPCVVQLGFAGSRRLFADPPTDPDRLRVLHEKLEQDLRDRLDRLPKELNLGSHYFLVGISQIACGADTIFTRACRARDNPLRKPIPQRMFLPQHRDAYLSAIGSGSKPDFTPDERKEAEDLLISGHIIQERVVSHSANRHEQFEDTNAEILRVSDVVVCLLREDATEGKAGGTDRLLERARRAGKPVLEIRVGIRDGQPAFVREQWHNTDEKKPFVTPELPEELRELPVTVAADPLPSREEYCEPLKQLVSRYAKRRQRLFRGAVGVIIATHILATLFATVALVTRHEAPGLWWLVLGLLGVELVLLLTGFTLHLFLGRWRAARVWATARVTAELARSLRAIGNRHVYLEHLFRLQLPIRFRPLLRTLSVLHLRSTWPHRNEPWELLRDKYVQQRLDHPENGQIGYYERALKKDRFWLALWRWVFMIVSVVAILATGTKLVLIATSDGGVEGWTASGPVGLGLLAIVLPAIAAGALSWAAALDYEARAETFRETLAFLIAQKPLLLQAASATEFERLLLETETALLGETANWFSRRSTKEAL